MWILEMLVYFYKTFNNYILIIFWIIILYLIIESKNYIQFIIKSNNFIIELKKIINKNVNFNKTISIIL